MRKKLLLLSLGLMASLVVTMANAQVEIPVEIQLQELSQELQEVKKTINKTSNLRPDKRLQVGGYGEIHFNAEEGEGKRVIDIHRFVLYLGYRFNQWIKFNSETEIEHAFVSDGDGEISIEQWYVDFFLQEAINIRLGRVLAPIGLVNLKHLPPEFNGVERPNVEKYIIPTTWSIDGAGLFGELAEGLKYKLYIGSSFDGRKFSALNGIRDGRMKERPGVFNPGLAGRVDIELPMMTDLGLSGFYGGVDNSNKGGHSGKHSSLGLLAVDLINKFDRILLKTLFTYSQVNHPQETGTDVGRAMMGYYVEAGWEVWPETWKLAKLVDSTAMIFVRWEHYDTHYKVDHGQIKNPAAKRKEITFGVNFYPVKNIVIKTDYQIKDDGTDNLIKDAFNVGLGWQF